MKDDNYGNGGPAFPHIVETEQYIRNEGMTLRDFFAAMAMQGRLADHTVDMSWNERAADAYQLADAMLKARGE